MAALSRFMRMRKQKFIRSIIDYLERRKKLFILFLFLIVIFVFAPPLNSIPEKIELFYASWQKNDYPNKTPENFFLPELVAHAGGGINGLTYTNSQEALDQSYQLGFRFFELDFNWTSDGQLILIHDWQEKAEQSLAEFKQPEITGDLTLLTLDDLLIWLEKRQDAYIITDVKDKNLAALKVISQKAQHLQSQIIPQIYRFYEYAGVRKLGYDKIIFTAYKHNYLAASLISFFKRHDLLAVTIPLERALTLAPQLTKTPIFIFTHTVNDRNLAEQLKKQGVNGFYTDFLRP